MDCTIFHTSIGTGLLAAPPAINTSPFCSKVAVASSLGNDIAPVVAKVPVESRYSYADARTMVPAKLFMPPTSSTLPVFKRVEV
jgi:hypothetical protein